MWRKAQASFRRSDSSRAAERLMADKFAQGWASRLMVATVITRAKFWERVALPGRQLNCSIRGELYEKAYDGIASRFLSVVRVPRADDYGIDAYCHIRRPLDAISSTVGGTFGVQIRGPGCNLQFGGMNEKGNT
jgi:hypothetical protein